MDITVTAEEPKDSKLVATLTVPAADVDRAIKAAYKEVANKYNFQGFRKGKAPRPVIDSMVGKQNILADATNDVLAQAEPLLLDQLDIVPVGDVDYGENLEPVAEHNDYVVTVTIDLIPEAELISYDPVSINMPPAEVTDAEIDQQLEVLMGYQAHYDEAEEGAEVATGDIVKVTVKDIENGERFAGDDRMLMTGSGMLPEALEEALVGMKVGDSKEVAFEMPGAPTEDDQEPEPVHVVVDVTLNEIQVKHVPELTDEFVDSAFGFENVQALRDAVAAEIKADKDQHLPSLKEERVIVELTKRSELEEVPEDYVKQVHDEIARQFLQDLQAQGQTVDSFLQMRHITMAQLMADMQEQAAEHASQSIALDALARHLDLQLTEDEVKTEFADVYGVKDVDKVMADFKKNGQMPAVRQTIRRSRAVKWLLDTAEVTEVDEVAEKRAADNQ